MGNLALEFTGRTVVVTGSARGIGKEVARTFATAGASVYLIDPDADEVKRSAEEVGGTAIVGDVSSTQDVQNAIGQMVRETGRVDIVVNNAGILRDKVLWKLTDEDWDQVLAVHAGGTFRMTRAAVPHFREQGYGRVINVTSFTGLHGNRGQANYATAKAGIIGFTKTAAKELAAFGVTVNAISPNAETRMIASIPENRREAVTAEIPLKRFAQPHEMAAAIAFLASEEAGYITGTILPVDGGLAM
ncbi:SDR family oxidoreductase [Nocardioides eburneiflavus]|uniref:SDR family oxidoreductase n=1 Tax=Nocardioides eburneiflavus TaxID=2518372 RepID=A0A4Z1C462_9ACTN|nr:SDR family NAD(P)-dependent oxidoreductase [Nocardioides eburneiflavus]TGN65074.1 SDR family oxidoreductase [Nocardioides eburneiflavus]